MLDATLTHSDDRVTTARPGQRYVVDRATAGAHRSRRDGPIAVQLLDRQLRAATCPPRYDAALVAG